MGLDGAFAARHGLTFASALGRTGRRLEPGGDTEFVARMKRSDAREVVPDGVAVVQGCAGCATSTATADGTTEPSAPDGAFQPAAASPRNPSTTTTVAAQSAVARPTSIRSARPDRAARRTRPIGRRAGPRQRRCVGRTVRGAAETRPHPGAPAGRESGESRPPTGATPGTRHSPAAPGRAVSRPAVPDGADTP